MSRKLVKSIIHLAGASLGGPGETDNVQAMKGWCVVLTSDCFPVEGN